jgi:TetR/AcrR family fatty acid metabolism transcriptional regulator
MFSRARGSYTLIALASETTSPQPNDAADATARGGGDKHRRILDAAIDVIAENGFFNARINEIAQRAGVADGTVYLYFKNKEHILRDAIASVFQQFFAQIRDGLDEATTCRDRLEIIARLHLEALSERRNLAILMQTELRQSANFIEGFSHQHIIDYLNLVRGVVKQGVESGELRAGISDRIVAHCLFGALDEIVSSWVFGRRVFDATTTAHEVVDVLFNGIHRKE